MKGEVVLEFISARFPQPFLRLSAHAFRNFLRDLPEHAVSGGSAYDELIAATAAEHNAELISCDRRAATIYERYGVRSRFV